MQFYDVKLEINILVTNQMKHNYRIKEQINLSVLLLKRPKRNTMMYIQKICIRFQYDKTDLSK